MQNFILKELLTSDIEKELERIGFDKSYRSKAKDKYLYKTIKIFDLSLPQANILKQTALTFGADCAVHRDVLTANIEKTDVILGGSYSQIKKICDKLSYQPFSMKLLSENIKEFMNQPYRKTKIVGILNLTPDSFSNDGCIDAYTARKRINEMIEEGADLIDVGAESTRPYSKNVSAEEQIRRLDFVLDSLTDYKIPFSIDTRSSQVARYALDKGAMIINDISGSEDDPKILDVVAEYDAEIILQHSTGPAENIVDYNDVVEDVYLKLKQKAELAESKGIKKIILDPGIGFGKTKEDNYRILNRIEEFYSLRYPIMVGVSRKSFLCDGQQLDNQTKDALTLAVSYPLIQKNIDYLRVHNVKLHKQLISSAI